ncbi:MAG: c-type cytochrome [Gammaproteobacteria bacterium]|nr:c-type cytochrome [Gammaproteobacteria bacterium]
MKFWVFAAVFGMPVLVTPPLLATVVPPGTHDEIRDRMEPFGSLCRTGDDCSGAGSGQAAGARNASATLTGEQVYSQFCFACHTTGISESPIFGDVQAWAPRIAKGVDVLWENTTGGLGLMPIRGTCMNCSDDELRAAMDYIIDRAK